MSLREALLSKLSALQAVADGASEGPWVYTVRANHRETGSMHYDIENPNFDGPCECGAKHPPGKLIAWLSGGLGEASLDRVRFRHDPPTEADARFIAEARSSFPLLLKALRQEVEAHGDPDDEEHCGFCLDDSGYSVVMPCPALRRMARALGVPAEEGAR